VERFIARINDQGQPGSRYGLISWANKPCDLFKLDQVVFGLRRLSVGLDWTVGDDWQVDDDLAQYKGRTFREALRELPSYQVRSSIKLPNRATTIAGQSLSDILHAWNFSFMRSQEDLEKVAPNTIAPQLGPMENSYLFLLWEYLTEENVRKDPYLLDGVKWFLNHIYIAKDARKEFERRLVEIGTSA
jgi:hypothetical protein